MAARGAETVFLYGECTQLFADQGLPIVVQTKAVGDVYERYGNCSLRCVEVVQSITLNPWN